MTKLEQYYNKFHEEHRLTTRHGKVEFNTTMHYILRYAELLCHNENQHCHPKLPSTCHPKLPSACHSKLPSACHSELVSESPNVNNILKIADIGAGTGRYSVELCHRGFDVTAVELVKHNLEILRSKHENIKTWQGDARNLSFLDDEIFDITLLFGPMYHLHGEENKLQAINEAKRITKKGGYILVAYVMNEYSIISYCFREHKWSEVAAKNGLTKDFHTICTEDDLYDYARMEDVYSLTQKTGLRRITTFAPDGAADYIRRELNEMSEEEFNAFLDFQLAISERKDLLGASSHIVDVLQKE